MHGLFLKAVIRKMFLNFKKLITEVREEGSGTNSMPANKCTLKVRNKNNRIDFVLLSLFLNFLTYFTSLSSVSIAVFEQKWQWLNVEAEMD